MNTGIIVKTAEYADLQEILAIQKEAYLQEAEIYNDYELPPLTQKLEELISEWNNGMVIKAEKNGQIVGSVRASMAGNTCKIGKLIVKPEFQNQGVGKILMNEIEKLFGHCMVYELFTGNKSEKNLLMYKKLGYNYFREIQVNENLKLIFLQKSNKFVD